MIVGGMFDIDTELMHQKCEQKEFVLRCDEKNQYQRKVYTNNGRTATTYALLHGIHITKEDVILIPEYNCISIINAIEAVEAPFEFYKIKEDLIIDIKDLKSKITEQTKVLYIIPYFGVPQPQEIVDQIIQIAKEKNLTIVEDITQALLTKDPGRIGFGDYIVASTRKWYPMTDGGIVAARDDVPFEMEELSAAYDEAVYKQSLVALERRYYQDDSNRDIREYLKLEKEANKARYIDFTPKAMTEASENVFFQTNHEESIRARRRNYTYLYNNLKTIEGIEVWGKPLDEEEKYVPFGFMVTVEKRDEFYAFLADHYIVGEIQWILPVQYYQPGEYAMYLSEHSLMLQCDQRYNESNMQYVVDVIQNFFKKK